MNKICCTCKILKPVTEFGSLKSSADGLAKSCKVCCRERVRQSKLIHPETVKKDCNSDATKERLRRFHKANPDKAKEYAAKRYMEHRDEILAYHRELAKRPDHREKRNDYYLTNKEVILNRSLDYQINNKEKVNEKNRNWYNKNKPKIKIYLYGK
jgi:hypothetical protein